MTNPTAAERASKVQLPFAAVVLLNSKDLAALHAEITQAIADAEAAARAELDELLQDCFDLIGVGKFDGKATGAAIRARRRISALIHARTPATATEGK